MSRQRNRGISLTELMVAIALLATATAGGVGAFAQARASHREAAFTQELHERAQYVFATLEPELQLAGYFAMAAAPVALPADAMPASAAGCGVDVVRRLDQGIGRAPEWTLACEARNGGALPGSDVLTVRRVAAQLSAAPEAGRAQWMSVMGTAGRLYWHGEADWDASSPVPGTELRDLLIRIFYVAREADGDDSVPALRMKSLTSIAGAPAFIDTEVMPGVEALHATLLPDAASPSAIEVRLRIRAGRPGQRTPRSIDIARTFALRNAH